jgi:hypothetical protein
MSGKCEKRWRLKWETCTLLDADFATQIEEDQPCSRASPRSRWVASGRLNRDARVTQYLVPRYFRIF